MAYEKCSICIYIYISTHTHIYIHTIHHNLVNHEHNAFGATGHMDIFTYAYAYIDMHTCLSTQSATVNRT